MTTKQDSYYPYFDWLRATLAIVVMVHHDKMIPWQHTGSLAVQVFFALSGWLIGGLLLNTRAPELPRFFFNRAVRIWAPYYLALGLVIAASVVREPVTAKWLEFVALKATFVYNIFGTTQIATAGKSMPLWGTANHFWSVNAEEQFYLLAPILLVLAPFGRSILLWAAIAVAAWASNTYASIIFGVFAAIIVQQHPGLHLRHRLPIFAACAVSGLAMPFAYEMAVAPFSICVVLLLAQTGEKTTLGTIAGGMSYPLYLNHWLGVFIGNALLGRFGLKDSPARMAFAIVLNIAIAVALYWWVDRKLLAKRGAVFTQGRGALAMLTGYGLICTGMAFGLGGALPAAIVANCFVILATIRAMRTRTAVQA